MADFKLVDKANMPKYAIEGEELEVVDAQKKTHRVVFEASSGRFHRPGDRLERVRNVVAFKRAPKAELDPSDELE